MSRSTGCEVRTSGVQCTSGQADSGGGSQQAGPEPSSTKCACRVAAQLGIIATGLEAACVGYVAIFTSSTVVSPPSPWAPMPSALTFSYSSMRNASSLFDGPRASRSNMSSGSISDSLAISIAFSAVPPMPMPSMPGGHQPAPIVGTVFSTQSTTESDGFSITSLDLFSEPPPLAATVTSTVSPGTSSTLTTAGVLSRVLRRSNSGSATTDARSVLTGSR